MVRAEKAILHNEKVSEIAQDYKDCIVFNSNCILLVSTLFSIRKKTEKEIATP